MEKWHTVALKYVTEYAKTRRVPKQHNVVVRAYSIACCPVVCGACCVWSTLARFIACPFQCIANGPQSSCSNNPCTAGTDACISLCLHETLRDVELPVLHVSMSSDEISLALKLVDALLDIFKENLTIFEKFHYDIVENVVSPLATTQVERLTVIPSNARKTLLSIKSHLESREMSLVS